MARHSSSATRRLTRASSSDELCRPATGHEPSTGRCDLSASRVLYSDHHGPNSQNFVSELTKMSGRNQTYEKFTEELRKNYDVWWKPDGYSARISWLILATRELRESYEQFTKSLQHYSQLSRNIFVSSNFMKFFRLGPITIHCVPDFQSELRRNHWR